MVVEVAHRPQPQPTTSYIGSDRLNAGSVPVRVAKPTQALETRRLFHLDDARNSG